MKAVTGTLVLLAVFLCGCHTHHDRPHGSPAESPRVVIPSHNPSDPWLDVYISDEERAIIHSYYAQHPSGKKLPPGLQKKVARGGKLPPGWQKKVARGQVLPGDLYRECRPLPPDLVRQLPPQRDDVVTVVLEGKIVRLAKATQVIIDTLEL